MANDNKQGQGNKEDQIGEGNQQADRRYRDDTEEYVKSGRPDPAGREAQRSMDDESERWDLEDAERRARQASSQSGSKNAGQGSSQSGGKNAGQSSDGDSDRSSGGGQRGSSGGKRF